MQKVISTTNNIVQALGKIVFPSDSHLFACKAIKQKKAIFVDGIGIVLIANSLLDGLSVVILDQNNPTIVRKEKYFPFPSPTTEQDIHFARIRDVVTTNDNPMILWEGLTHSGGRYSFKIKIQKDETLAISCVSREYAENPFNGNFTLVDFLKQRDGKQWQLLTDYNQLKLALFENGNVIAEGNYSSDIVLQPIRAPFENPEGRVFAFQCNEAAHPQWRLVELVVNGGGIKLVSCEQYIEGRPLSVTCSPDNRYMLMTQRLFPGTIIGGPFQDIEADIAILFDTANMEVVGRIGLNNTLGGEPRMYQMPQFATGTDRFFVIAGQQGITLLSLAPPFTQLGGAQYQHYNTDFPGAPRLASIDATIVSTPEKTYALVSEAWPQSFSATSQIPIEVLKIQI